MLIKNTQKIIKFCVIIIGIGVWDSCNNKTRHMLIPVDNVESYKLSKDHDTTTIIENRNKSSQELIKFYQDNNEIITSDYGGHKELLMSTTKMLDTVYSGDTYRRHRIQIKRENSNLFSTFIYHIDIKPMLIITIYYDYSYNIKAIRNWSVYTTYRSKHDD